MVEFYCVYYRRSIWDGFHLKNLLFSAGAFWDKKFRKPILPSYENLFLDSGGFQLVNKFGKYPFTPKEYYDYVQEINPNYFASMDIPCDARCHQTIQTLPNKERIEKSIENNIELMKFDDDRLVPVIQGGSRGEYLYCIDRMKEQGLIKPYMAIGSLCIRKQTKEIKYLINVIKHELPKVKLHTFGVKISIFEDNKMWNRVHSCDSMAWSYPVQFGAVTIFTGKRLLEVLPRRKNTLTGQEMNYLCVRAYIEYWNYIKEKHEKINREQQTLDKFKLQKGS